MESFKAKSGAEIKINIAPWADAKQLKKAVQKEVKFTGEDLNLKWFIEQIFQIDGCDAFEYALWACLKHCTRDNARITPEIMDTEEGRNDYVEIVSACVQVNLGPLVESLLLKFKELEKEQAEKGQK